MKIGFPFENQPVCQCKQQANEPIRILPISAIFGGNASGKTNLVRALEFAKNLVVFGTDPDEKMTVETFLLDECCLSQPSHFSFSLLVEELIYEFSFRLTREAIVEEKLVEMNSSSRKTLYDRRSGEPNYNPSLPTQERLQFVFEGTRGNQLLLTNLASQNLPKFAGIY